MADEGQKDLRALTEMGTIALSAVQQVLDEKYDLSDTILAVSQPLLEFYSKDSNAWIYGFGKSGGVTTGRRHASSEFRLENSAGTPAGSLEREGSLEEMRQLLKPRRPPPGYMCHVCFSTEHFVRLCPVGLNIPSRTPYKGPKRSIGVFICPGCKKKWTSMYSYAGEGQKCWRCAVNAYPKKQYPLHELGNPRSVAVHKYVNGLSKRFNYLSLNDDDEPM
uniref:Zinc-binding domain-containing protein n=1 Tax=Trichuris muris TaxID=70415 RepID=A0A5S6QWG9_TRIMR